MPSLTRKNKGRRTLAPKVVSRDAGHTGRLSRDRRRAERHRLLGLLSRAVQRQAATYLHGSVTTRKHAADAVWTALRTLRAHDLMARVGL